MHTVTLEQYHLYLGPCLPEADTGSGRRHSFPQGRVQKPSWRRGFEGDVCEQRVVGLYVGIQHHTLSLACCCHPRQRRQTHPQQAPPPSPQEKQRHLHRGGHTVYGDGASGSLIMDRCQGGVCNSLTVCFWSRKTASRSPLERAMAHSDQSSGKAETTHIPHTEKARSQLLDLHPVPTHC